jgi:hypothetical protein
VADVKLKVGDTFIADCTYKDANGNPVNLNTAGIVIRSSVRSPNGVKTYPLDVTIKDQAVTPGGYRLRSDTSGWELGRLAWDIRYTNAAGVSSSSDTVMIELRAAVT